MTDPMQTTPTGAPDASPTNEQQDARACNECGGELDMHYLSCSVWAWNAAKRPLAAVSAAAPDERERAQRYTTVLANLNREQARAVAAEAERDEARAALAALRERVVRMADSLDRLASNAPSTYAGIRHTIAGELRALAAAPSEMEEGRA